jgi:hypothetical protein
VGRGCIRYTRDASSPRAQRATGGTEIKFFIKTLKEEKIREFRPFGEDVKTVNEIKRIRKDYVDLAVPRPFGEAGMASRSSALGTPMRLEQRSSEAEREKNFAPARHLSVNRGGE